MAFYFILSCLRSCVLLRCKCMYVYLATNTISIHEYMHILVIKKITDNTNIRIKITLNYFSIIPCSKVYGLKSILIACSGPIVCFIISMFLYLIKQLFALESFFIDLLIYSYGCHIFSMLPFFKDGKMILKEVIYFLLEGGENQ